MTDDMCMTPIPIPPEAAASRPTFKALRIGPPPGVSDTDCGTVEALTGYSDEGYPMLAGYWRPTPTQLEALANGGFIELVQYAPRMVMHSMTVWDVPATTGQVEGCGWVDCQEPHPHEHPSEFTWVNPGDPAAGHVVVLVKADGTVTISEAALAQLLVDAGWERAR